MNTEILYKKDGTENWEAMKYRRNTLFQLMAQTVDTDLRESFSDDEVNWFMDNAVTLVPEKDEV